MRRRGGVLGECLQEGGRERDGQKRRVARVGKRRESDGGGETGLMQIHSPCVVRVLARRSMDLARACPARHLQGSRHTVGMRALE